MKLKETQPSETTSKGFATEEENSVCPAMEIDRYWLDIPYAHQAAARRRNYIYDKEARCWYDPNSRLVGNKL
eukprot:20895-Heterococcus_DN1.PRE.10